MITGTREDVIEYLKDFFNGKDVVGVVLWSPQDVLCRYTDIYDGDWPFPMSDEEATGILKKAINRHDANIGINWYVFDVYIYDWIQEKQQ